MPIVLTTETPVVLTDSRSSLAANAQLPFDDPTAFTNPFRTGMLIDAIEVGWDTAVSAPMPADLWWSLELSRRGESYRITNNYVPAWLTGKWQSALQSLYQGANGACQLFYWKLKHPLYVAPNEWVNPALYHRAAFNTNAFTNPRVTIIGRALAYGDAPPSKNWRPWVTAWVGNLRRGNTTSTDKSSEANLFNPFPRPLHVERFTGQVAYYDANGVNGSGGFGERFTTVRAVNSMGKILVRDQTPFDHLFHVGSRSWTVNTQLYPKGFFNFYADEPYTTANGFQSNDKIQPQIVMVGYQLEN